MRTMTELYDLLKAHGPAIGKASAEGDKSAKAVMDFYGLHYRCPSDGAAVAFLDAALDEWLANESRRLTSEGKDAAGPSRGVGPDQDSSESNPSTEGGNHA